ncbi:Ankyrin-3 [Dactylellina cionopaga]|nr:Ankyrin-3 [Dactylellina cionopaga]
MDNLTSRSYMVTRQNYHPDRVKPQERRRRTSFSRRSISAPGKDRKKLDDSKHDAHEEYLVAQSAHVAELDGIIGRRSKKTSPTTPKSPEIKIDDARIFPKDYEASHRDEKHNLQIYRTNSSSGELRPPSQRQSGEAPVRGRKMSGETYRSSATTIAPHYVHEAQEPDSPTLPAMANPKVLASIPRNIQGLSNQGAGASSSSSGGVLPVLQNERAHPGSPIQTTASLSRRLSSRTPSSAVATSPNPFLMRDLPDSLRDLVLDQGLTVCLKDGTRFEMGSDDVQCAKQILNAWNIYEGNLGGGISHEKAYLCLLNSKLRKDQLAEIWDSCQTIVDPPMPLRMNHSLFPEEFIVAIHLIHQYSRLDMDTIQHNLTAKSPLMSQRKAVTSNILINGNAVACPDDAEGMVFLFGGREGILPPQTVLDKCLYIAASKGYRRAVATLLDWRADIDALNTASNRRALHAACENGHEDVVRILLQRGASVNVADEDGKTPLHLAAADGGEGITRMLIQSGADLNAVDDEGDLPLHVAADNGSSDIVPLFLRARVKVDTPGFGKRSPLMRAVANGHKATVRCLLDEGANVNQRDETGWTALHWAVRNGNETLTRILLEEGANIHERTHDEQNAICLAVQHDMKSLVRFLVENRAAIDGYGANGMAPIHIAAMMGKERVLAVLLESGARVNNYTKGSAINSQTALMIAIIQQNEGIVRILLNHPQINLEAEDRNRSTALHYAVPKGNIQIVKLLLEKNPRLEDMNMDGKAPVDLAKDKEIKDLLKAAAKNSRLPRKFSI